MPKVKTQLEVVEIDDGPKKSSQIHVSASQHHLVLPSFQSDSNSQDIFNLVIFDRFYYSAQMFANFPQSEDEFKLGKGCGFASFAEFGRICPLYAKRNASKSGKILFYRLRRDGLVIQLH